MTRATLTLMVLVLVGCGATRETYTDVSTDVDATGDVDAIDPGSDVPGDATDVTSDADVPLTPLTAEGTAPSTLEGGIPGCAACDASRPSAVWDGSSVHVAYQLDEDVHDKRIRIARLNAAGSVMETPVPSLVDTGESTHAFSDPHLALTGDAGTPLAAVWMDGLGGARLSFLEFENSGDPIADAAGWLMDPAGPVIQASWPSIAAGDGEAYSAFIAQASGASHTDVFISRFVSGTLDATFGTDGFVKLSDTEMEDEEGRPAVAVVASVAIAAWPTPGRGLRAATTSGTEVRMRDVPLPGIFGSVRDVIIVNSPTDDTSPRAFILFSAIPDDTIETEVWAVGVNVSYFNNGTFPDENVFGTPVRISESPNHFSTEVAACWHGGSTGVMGVAYNDGRSDRGIWFRLVGGLSGTPYVASEEVHMGDSTSTSDQLASPSVACITSQTFGVLWSDGVDLFYRRVVPAS